MRLGRYPGVWLNAVATSAPPIASMLQAGWIAEVSEGAVGHQRGYGITEAGEVAFPTHSFIVVPTDRVQLCRFVDFYAKARR